MKTVALEEHWRQVKRWAWRYLNLAHPGGKIERNDPAPVIPGSSVRCGTDTETPTQTLAQQRADEMNAQSATLGAALSAWEAHRSRVAPPIEPELLFRTPVRGGMKGLQAITPNIIVHDADAAAAFLGRAFGIRENYRLTTRQGKIAHCELQLGNSVLNLGDSLEGWPVHGLVAQIHVEDPDTVFDQAVLAGATVIEPMTDTIFGSREGRLADPFGNLWIIARRTEELCPLDMQRRMAAHEH